MDQAQEGRVCPYCAGKGYVLEEIENVPTEHGEQLLLAQRPGHARNVHCAAVPDVFSVLANLRPARL